MRLEIDFAPPFPASIESIESDVVRSTAKEIWLLSNHLKTVLELWQLLALFYVIGVTVDEETQQTINLVCEELKSYRTTLTRLVSPKSRYDLVNDFKSISMLAKTQSALKSQIEFHYNALTNSYLVPSLLPTDAEDSHFRVMHDYNLNLLDCSPDDGFRAFWNSSIRLIHYVITLVKTLMLMPANAIRQAGVNPEQDRPKWNEKSRELWYGGNLCKSLRQPAKDQSLILTAFEEGSWAEVIADPIVPHTSSSTQARKDRLKSAVSQVANRKLQPPLKFHVAGGGTKNQMELRPEVHPRAYNWLRTKRSDHILRFWTNGIVPASVILR